MLRRLAFRVVAAGLRRVRLRLERELLELQIKATMEAMAKMPPAERTIITLGAGFYDLTKWERLQLMRRALRERIWN